MAFTGLGRLTIDMVMQTAGFEQGMSRAERIAQKKAREMQRSINAVSTAVVGAATAVQAFATKIFVSTSQSVEATAKMAQQIGVTTEALTSMRYAAQQFSNISNQTFDMSMRRMNRRIAEAATGSGAASNALKSLGIDAKQLAQQSPDKQFMAIADAMSKVQENGNALRYTMAIFDTEGMPLVNALRQGSDELQVMKDRAIELGFALSDADAAVIQDLNTALADVNLAMDSVLEKTVVALAPSMKEMADNIMYTFESIDDVGGKVATVFNTINDAILALTAVMVGRYVGALSATALSTVKTTMATAALNYQMAITAGRGPAAAAALTAVATAGRGLMIAVNLAGGPVGILTIALSYLALSMLGSSKESTRAAEALEKYSGSVDDTKAKLIALTEVQRKNELSLAESKVPALWKEQEKAVKELADAVIIYQLNAGKGARESQELYKRIREGKVSTQELVAEFERLQQNGVISPQVMSSILDLSSKVDGATASAKDAEGIVERLKQVIFDLGLAGSTAASGVGELNAQLIEAQAAGAKYLENLVKGNITAGIKTELGRLQALIKSGELAFETPEQEAQALAAAGLRDKLTASTTKTTKATNDAAKAMQNLLDKLLPMEKITKDFETDQKMLNDALKKGKIDSEQYESAMARLNRQREDAVRNLIPEEEKRMKDLQRTTASGLQTFIIQQERMLEGMGRGEQWNELANALGQVEDKYRGIAEQMMASGRGVSPEDLEVLKEYMEAEMAVVQYYHDRKVELENSYWEGAQQGIQDYIDSVGTASEQMASVMSGAFRSLEDTLYDFVLTGELNLGDMLRNIGQSVVRMLVQMGVQMAANFVMAQLFSRTAEATSAMTGASIASSYAPAAAMASLASFGANAAPATAGILSTLGVAKMSAFSGMFDDGGNISAGKWGIVGEFGPEIVQGPANVTSREDTMRMFREGQGRDAGNSDVIVQFYGNPDSVQSVDTDTNEFGQRVIRVLINDLAVGGEYSTSLIRSTNVQRVPR